MFEINISLSQPSGTRSYIDGSRTGGGDGWQPTPPNLHAHKCLSEKPDNPHAGSKIKCPV